MHFKLEVRSGNKPHPGKNIKECLKNAAENIIQPLEQKGELVKVAMKAMASSPDDRYSSVKEFQKAIQAYQSHAESVVLVEQADKALTEAAKTKSYADYARAMFTFEQAIELWDNNRAALNGVSVARLAYANCAYQKGDYAQAESLLQEAKLLKTPLGEKVLVAKSIQEERVKRVKTLTRMAIVLGAVVIIILTGAFFWIRGEQAQSAAERDRAMLAEANAMAERDKVLSARKAELLQRQEALIAKQALKDEMKKRKKLWQTVFVDEFDEKEINPLWKVLGGSWRIENGWLVCESRRMRKGSQIIIKKDLPGDLRISFQARTNNSGNPEIALVVFAKESNPYESGYFITFKKDGNKIIIKRNETELWSSSPMIFHPGKKYTFHFERIGRRIRLFVGKEKKLIADLEDWGPPFLAENKIIGLYTWNGHMEVERIEIQQAVLPQLATSIDFAYFLKSRARYDLAIDSLNDMIQVSKNKSQIEKAMIAKAECFLAAGDKKNANKIFDKILIQFPSDKNYFSQACIKIRMGESTSGILEELNKYYPVHTRWNEVFTLIVDQTHTLLLKKNEAQFLEIKEALLTAESCISHFGNSKQKKVANGLLHKIYLKFSGHKSKELKKQILEKTSIYFKKIAKIKPNDCHNWKVWGKMLYKTGQREEAIEKFKKAAECSPKDGFIWDRLANIYLELGKFEEALFHMKKVVDCDPTSPIGWYNYGVHLNMLDKKIESMLAYKKATELDSNCIDAWYNWGVLLRLEGRNEEALEKIKKSIELGPHLIKPWNNLFMVLNNLGRYEDVFKAYRRQIIAMPKSAQIQNYYAWALMTCKDNSLRDPGLALIHAKKANELSNSKSPAILDTLARAFFENSQISDAIKTQEKALLNLPKNTNETYQKSFSKSLEKYKTALKLKVKDE